MGGEEVGVREGVEPWPGDYPGRVWVAGSSPGQREGWRAEQPLERRRRSGWRGWRDLRVGVWSWWGTLTWQVERDTGYFVIQVERYLFILDR